MSGQSDYEDQHYPTLSEAFSISCTSAASPQQSFLTASLSSTSKQGEAFTESSELSTGGTMPKFGQISKRYHQ